MKVLVTGSGGFIGYNMCLDLLRGGHSVVAAYRSSMPDDLARAVREYGGRLEPVKGDLLDPVTYERLAPLGIEGVVHSAVITCPNISERDAYVYMVRNNIDSTVNLVEFCMKHEIMDFVYVSSSGVYGSLYGAGATVSEEAPLDLYSTYTVTKRSCELIVARFGAITGARAVSARISSPYGDFERVTNSRANMSPPYMMVHAALDKRRLVIHGPDLGRDWTYVDDIINGIYLLLTVPREQLRHTEYNVSCGEPGTNRDIAQAVLAAEPDFSYIFCKDTEEADMVLFPPITRGAMDIGRLKADTGFRPRFSLKEGIAKYCAHQKRQNERAGDGANG